MRAILLSLLLLTAAACGPQAGGPSAATSPSRRASPDPPAAGVAAILTGVPVVADDGGVEWCPYGNTDGCPGIRVTGLSPHAVSRFGDLEQAWRVEGRFDGRRLAASGPPEPAEWAPSYDFTTPCAGLRGTGDRVGNPEPAAAEAVARYTETIPDRYAGDWWDSDAAVMTVLLTGDDVAEDRAALEEAVGDRGTVCVVGGARYTHAELDRAQGRAGDVAIDAGPGLGSWSSSVDPVGNRVVLTVDHSDEQVRERIRRQTGDMVRVNAFLALRDVPLAELPEPPSRGDVELETVNGRSGAGMGAAANFTVRFDAERRCVYGELGAGRIGLVWPFGYYATSDPLQVFDQDGRMVAREGDTMFSGGGQVRRSGRRACGANEVWVMSSRPEAVVPSEG